MSRKIRRPHQRRMIDAIIEGLTTERRVRAIAACGSGKTLIAKWATDDLGAQRIVVMAPSLGVIAQTARAWQLDSGAKADLFCCDDNRVPSDLLGAAVCTTAPAEMLDILRLPTWLTFCTYQSSRALADALRRTKVKPDITVLDEAHRLAGAAGLPFKTVLDDEKFPSLFRLFMTATPKIVISRNDDIDVASMDDEALFGPEVDRLSFKRAIDLKILADYCVYGAAVREQPADEREAEWARHTAVAKEIHNRGLKSAILFYRTCREARSGVDMLKLIVKQLGLNPDMRIQTIFGTDPLDVRDEVMRAVTSIGGMAATVRALGEGIDCPAVDCVAFMNPKESTVEIVQAVGRALRLSHPGKIAGIVVPVMISGTGDAAQLDDQSTSAMINVLAALRAHDDRLDRHMSALCNSTAKKKIRKEPGWPSLRDAAKFMQQHLVLDGWTVNAQAALLKKITLPLNIKTTTPHNDKWFASWFPHLERYVAEFGHSAVPSSYVSADGLKLGVLVASMRRDVVTGSGTVSRTNIKKLEALPLWCWRKSSTELAAYKFCVRWENFVKQHNRAPKQNSHNINTEEHNIARNASAYRSGFRQNKDSIPTSVIDQISELPLWTWNCKRARRTPPEVHMAAITRLFDDAPQKLITRQYVQNALSCSPGGAAGLLRKAQTLGLVTCVGSFPTGPGGWKKNQPAKHYAACAPPSRD